MDNAALCLSTSLSVCICLSVCLSVLLSANDLYVYDEGEPCNGKGQCVEHADCSSDYAGFCVCGDDFYR